jgi:ribosome-associated heat shock protein Hsp15|tara:strand:+ start:3002 stop:3430 length:429 start_codon:yes stop_codon:yes gene_type:complete
MRFFQLSNKMELGGKIRLDKWLWAARFFKTRSLAKAAITGGKVHIGGQRAKASRDLAIGAIVTVKQGIEEKTIVVKRLSSKRSTASKTTSMYSETAESVLLRINNTAKRKALNNGITFDERPPNKKQRRQIHRFNENNKYNK